MQKIGIVIFQARSVWASPADVYRDGDTVRFSVTHTKDAYMMEIGSLWDVEGAYIELDSGQSLAINPLPLKSTDGTKEDAVTWLEYGTFSDGDNPTGNAIWEDFFAFWHTGWADFDDFIDYTIVSQAAGGGNVLIKNGNIITKNGNIITN